MHELRRAGGETSFSRVTYREAEKGLYFNNWGKLWSMSKFLPNWRLYDPFNEKPVGSDRSFDGSSFDHFQLNADKCYSTKVLLVNSDKFPRILPFHIVSLPKVEFVTKVQAVELQKTDLIEQRLLSHWLSDFNITSNMDFSLKHFNPDSLSELYWSKLIVVKLPFV